MVAIFHALVDQVKLQRVLYAIYTVLATKIIAIALKVI